MRALQQISKNQQVKLNLLEKLKLKSQKEEDLILIKVLYSPLNPSDFGFLGDAYGKNTYNKYPKPLGFEGSGIIEDASSNSKNLIGKKVSFCCNYDDEKYFRNFFFLKFS